MRSVLQDWVMELPLRYQGTLLTAVRGCDSTPMVHSMHLNPESPAQLLNRLTEDRIESGTVVS